MDPLTGFLLVGLGSAVGGMLRHAASLALPYDPLADHLPLATMGVNILGSLLIGYLAATLVDARFSLLLATGFCGGFTTFSAFSLQSLGMLQQGEYVTAAIHAGVSVGACVIATGLGWWLGGQA